MEVIIRAPKLQKKLGMIDYAAGIEERSMVPTARIYLPSVVFEE